MLSYVDISDENPGPPRCDDVIRSANKRSFYFCWMGPNDSKLLIKYSNDIKTDLNEIITHTNLNL